MAIGDIGLGEVLKFADQLKKGLKVFKCKLDGKPTQVNSGEMKLDGSNVVITCAFQDGGAQHNVKAVNPIFGHGETLQLDGQAVPNAKVRLTFPKHITGIDAKATVDYSQAGSSHELEIYAEGLHLPIG